MLFTEADDRNAWQCHLLMIGGGYRMFSVMLTRAILDSHHPPWPRLPWRGCRGLATSAPASSSRQRDLYTVLGVAATAETKEIKENFYKLSKEFHPDVNKDESSLKKFREIVEAYEVTHDWLIGHNTEL